MLYTLHAVPPTYLGVTTQNGQVLGQNGDTALLFLVLIVHDTVTGIIRLGLVAKDTRLTNQGVHESGFSVVNVRNHGNVTANGRRCVYMFV